MGCFEEVKWAMQTYILDHPEWYAPLTAYSSFEDFQLFLHSTDSLSEVSPKTCPALRPEVRLPEQAEDCRTSAQADSRYKEVKWVMLTGFLDLPEWYTPLNDLHFLPSLRGP